MASAESHLEQMLPELIHRNREPRVGITVSQATITLRITASGSSHDECLAAIRPTEATIRETLGDLVFGEEDDELQQIVIRQLRLQQKTLATVEWGTTGLLSQWLSDVSDSAEYYHGGLTITNDKTLKTALNIELPVDKAERFDDGETLANSMAASCRDQFGADFGLAVGPLAKGDGQAGPLEYFAIGLATPDALCTRRASLAGHPEIIVPRAAKHALDLIRRVLLGLRSSE